MKFSLLGVRLFQQNSPRLVEVTLFLVYPTSTGPMAGDDEFYVWPKSAVAPGSGGDELSVEAR